MVLVLGCPMVLVLPKEKPLLCVVVVWPNGLKRLLACCGVCWPNRPPVVVLNPPVAATDDRDTALHLTNSKVFIPFKWKISTKVGNFRRMWDVEPFQMFDKMLDGETSALG